eukprot:1598802-Amphidinium_carterae.1
MQKRVFNISTQLSSRELGLALEITKKHGKRLTPKRDYEAYRADVMTARGGQYQAQAAPSPRHGNPEESMNNQCATPIGDDQMERFYTESRESATGRSAPMKGRPKQIHAEACNEGRHSEPDRMGMTERDTPTPIRGRSVIGRSDPERRD